MEDHEEMRALDVIALHSSGPAGLVVAVTYDAKSSQLVFAHNAGRLPDEVAETHRRVDQLLETVKQPSMLWEHIGILARAQAGLTILERLKAAAETASTEMFPQHSGSDEVALQNVHHLFPGAESFIPTSLFPAPSFPA